MLYELIEIRKGKQNLVMRDSLSKVKNRLNTLRKSHGKGIKNQRVDYKIVPCDNNDNEKFWRKPHNPCIGGCDCITPPKIR